MRFCSLPEGSRLNELAAVTVAFIDPALRNSKAAIGTLALF